jgi:archaea-specific RecJ-like exonuclease
MKNNRKFQKNKGNFNKPKNNFEHMNRFISREVKEMSLSEITKNHLNSQIKVIGIIQKVNQTGGPTIFSLSDGTGTLPLKAFVGQGERAYPEINEGDTVKTTVIINEYNQEIEGDIKEIKKLDPVEHKIYLEKIKSIQEKRANINFIPFLVKSDILDKLKDKILEAAFQIKLAIIQNRPIIIRHHNDTDGYSAGFALEKAILPLIEKENKSEKAGYEYFMRAPCQAPFYEIDDSIRDTSTSLRNEAKFSNKMPLVIITDNGSTPEDLFGILQGKIHGMDFIVIDHHYFDKDMISEQVLVHINPFLVKEDGAKFSAGMLSAEVARQVNNVPGLDIIPALAGYADRIDLLNQDIMEKYLEIAKKQGYTKELLEDISKVIDFVSAKVRFMEVREYIGVIFGEPRIKQKELVGLMAPYIKELEEKALIIAESNAKTEKIGKTTLQSLDIENTFPGFGFYPKPGRCVGMVHDSLKNKKKITNLVTAGIMRTAITLRATDESNFSTHELINYLKNKTPTSFVEGGGHKNAGSISFLPGKHEEIIRLLKEFIKQRQR